MSFHDDRPIGWTNPHTGVTYTRDRAFSCAMDNYEPVPRTVKHGTLQEWTEPDGTRHSYSLTDWGTEREANRAVYLIDDGRTVVPHYVAGWSNDQDRLTLRPFPVNVNTDGSPKMRADRDEQVDHTGWMHGPVRTYHLKITRG